MGAHTIMVRRIAAILFMVLLLAGPRMGHAAERDSILVGAVLSATGAHAVVTEHMRRGYELAARRINEQGGVKVGNRAYPLKIIYEDDQSRPEVAAQAAAKLVKRGVVFMLGPYTGALVEPVAQVTEKAEMPLVHSAISLSLFKPDRHWLFGVSTTADQYLTGALAMVVDQAAKAGRTPRQVSYAIAACRDVTCGEVRAAAMERAASLGLNLVLDEALPNPVDDIAGVLTRVQAAHPDLFMVFDYASGAAVTARQVAEFKINLPLVVLTHCDAAAIEQAGPAADYLVCSSQWDAYAKFPDRRFGTSVDFLLEYELTYGAKPPYQAAMAAASVMVLADAIERAGRIDRKAVRDALARTDSMTFFGPVRFDELGRNIAKPMVYAQLQGGRYKVVWPRDMAWAQMIYPMPRWEDR